MYTLSAYLAMDPPWRLVMVVVFADLAGFTAYAESHGDVSASRAALRFSLAAMQIGRRHRLRPIKTLGDAVLMVGSDCAAAVAAARAVVGRFDGRDGTPPAHVGVHVGPVVEQDGDVFGQTVNVAARLSAAAEPGHVLVTREVTQACAEPPSQFRELGPRHLRGISRPLELFDLPAGQGSAA